MSTTEVHAKIAKSAASLAAALLHRNASIRTAYKDAYYKITASNAQTIYGYGSSKEASAYLASLNAEKEINLYGSEEMTADEVAVARLEKRDDIVNLEEAGW